MEGDAREKYRSLAEAAPDAIFLVDLTDATISEVNERTEELLGYDRSELAGKTVADVHPAEDLDGYWEMFDRTTQRETIRFDTLPDGSQVEVVTADGERVPVEIHVKRVEVDGSPHVFLVVRDVSTQLARREQLERATEELAVLNRLLRHDIRNDMSVVLGWLDRLEQHVDPDHHDTVERIRSHGSHVVDLTKLARDYVEVITEEAEPELEPVDLHQTLTEELDACRSANDAVDAGLAAGAETDVSVQATPLLCSVFRNLLNNAVQHNDRAEPTVRVDATVTDDTVTVRVADDGPGIPDEEKASVFGRGEQGLDSSGTGIGLYLVDRLITQFGGDVRVRDRDPASFPLPSDDPASDRSTAGDEFRDDAPAGSVFVVELRRA